MRIFVRLLVPALFCLCFCVSPARSDESRLSREEMDEFVTKAEANFVSEIGLPEEALNKRWRRDSLKVWIPEGTSYEEVVRKLESINASRGFCFRIIRDENYVCIERTYYRRRDGLAISLMIVMDENQESTVASLSRSLYKLPISGS
ncbi:hypothetical protein [Pelagicoccus mobilis]|uniref:DUF4252 domain-containing protein n=1 Tax=Pelagicoccus mobilis TaxID=415221 RepID=A0A934S0C0_9BACT|nr:hypothetical protein [Pelagicoccus mobilis]MBK1877572.1 hypothetical protein [Pelagicoccus mobilis]